MPNSNSDSRKDGEGFVIKPGEPPPPRSEWPFEPAPKPSIWQKAIPVGVPATILALFGGLWAMMGHSSAKNAPATILPEQAPPQALHTAANPTLQPRIEVSTPLPAVASHEIKVHKPHPTTTATSEKPKHSHVPPPEVGKPYAEEVFGTAHETPRPKR